MSFIGDMYRQHKELILYGVYGVLTTLVTWLSYMGFVNIGFELNVCNILSWVCGVTFAFITNKWFVFESRSLAIGKIFKELILFIGSRIFTGIIAWILFPILLWLGLDYFIFDTEGFLAKVIVSIVEIILNWVLSKYMVFKKNKPEESEQ